MVLFGSISSGPAGQPDNIRAIMRGIGKIYRKLGVTNRISTALLGLIAGIFLVSGETRSGTTTYDMSSLLFQQHPFSTRSLIQPVVAVPVAPIQNRAPARIPQSVTPSRAVFRQAAQPNASERRPATAAPLLPAPPRTGGNGIKGAISEIRLGALVHDENRDHQGAEAIRQWIADSTREFQPKNEVLSVKGEADVHTVISKISGSFPGSPIELRFRYVVTHGKISHLAIQ